VIIKLKRALGIHKRSPASQTTLDLESKLDEVRRAILVDFRQNEDFLEGEDLSYIIEYFRSLKQSEDEREKQIEGKAATLIGVTGLTGGFIAATLQSLFSVIQGASSWVILLVALLYLGIAIILLITIIQCLRALEVGRSQSALHDPRELFKLRADKRQEVLREYAKGLLGTQLYNQIQINEKAGTVISAQRTYFVGIVLTAALVLVMTFSWLGNVASQGKTSPTFTSVPTVQVNFPAVTQVLAPSATITPATNNPRAKPTPTL
jgi:MFS family permease